MPTALTPARRALTALLTGALVAAAGCGGSGSDTATATATAGPPATTAGAATTITAAPARPQDPSALVRAALLGPEDLPTSFAPEDLVTRYDQGNLVSDCLQPLPRPRAGATGAAFRDEENGRALFQTVELYADDAAAQQAIAALRTKRAERCLLTAFDRSNRAAAQRARNVRFSRLRAVRLELPSVLWGDDVAGLRLCVSIAFSDSRSNQCNDVVLVRYGAATTMVSITTVNEPEAASADEIGSSAAMRLEQTF